MEHKGIFYAQMMLRAMINDFLNEFSHQRQWEKINTEYKEAHGISKGSESLSMQSYIGSDLLIDFIYLAQDAEAGEPFINEYWIRSMGTQCCRTESAKEAVRGAFRDILAKISVTLDGKEFTDIHWIEDEECLIKNNFVEEKVLCRYRF